MEIIPKIYHNSIDNFVLNPHRIGEAFISVYELWIVEAYLQTQQQNLYTSTRIYILFVFLFHFCNSLCSLSVLTFFFTSKEGENKKLTRLDTEQHFDKNNSHHNYLYSFIILNYKKGNNFLQMNFSFYSLDVVIYINKKKKIQLLFFFFMNCILFLSVSNNPLRLFFFFSLRW